MEILALVILILLSLAGFACIFFTSFGTNLIFIGSFIYAALTGFDLITIPTLIVLLILYLASEVAEYIFVVMGAKMLGASTRAVWFAVIGGIFGALGGILLAGIGVFLGAILGIFLGAFIAEMSLGRDFRQSLKSGAGGVLGRLGSIAAKAIIALCMFAIIIAQLWGHHT